MITGYEEPVLFPSMNLYDTGMMQMYINAAREQYNQNREDMKEFIKQYGDFVSPISADMQWVDEQTRGRINDAMNYLQQNGIDPLRSAEGRAVIQRVINTTNVAGINARRQSAENRKLWDKAAAALKVEGKYNEDFANWAFNQKYKVNPDQWNTSVNGIFQETSPEAYQDLNSATKAWYDQMQPGYLGTTLDGYDYIGNTPDDVRAIAKQNLPDLTSTYWLYQKELARRQLGPDATPEQINDRLMDNIVAAQAERYMRPTRVENADYKRQKDFYNSVRLDDIRTQNDIRVNEEDERTKYKYKALEAADTNLDGILDEDEIANYDEAAREALKNGGYTNNSNSNNGSNNGTQPASEVLGPADQLDVQQLLNQNRNKEDLIGQYARQKESEYQKQKKIYNTLTDSQKKNAVAYGKAYRTLRDSKATTEAKTDAELTIRGLDRSTDPNFVKWRNQFNYRMENFSEDPQIRWLNKSTTQGRAGYQKSNEDALHDNSHAIFEKNNIVTDLSSDQQLALNKQLGYTVNDDNGRDGLMTSNRDFADITIAEMTGNRGYRHASIPQQISRAIKNKEFSIDNKNVAKRKYGAGTIGNKRYNVIVELATFSDPDVIAALDNIHIDRLTKFGVKKTEDKDGNTVNYKVPIISKFGHGQGRASVNNIGLQSSIGKAAAAKQMLTQQAKEITANMYGQ